MPHCSRRTCPNTNRIRYILAILLVKSGVSSSFMHYSNSVNGRPCVSGFFYSGTMHPISRFDFSRGRNHRAFYKSNCRPNSFALPVLRLAGDSVNENVENAESTEQSKSKGKKKKKRSTANKTKLAEESYWHDESDELVIVENGDFIISGCGNSRNITTSTNIDSMIGKINLFKKSIKFTLRGNPRPLIRHRAARGYVYNPSQKAQESFRDALLKILPRKYHPTIIDDESLDHLEETRSITPIVLFSEEEFLDMSIVFRTKRPKNHFVASKPGPGRLKATAPGKLHNSRSDVDNLAKFVMDSLNCLLYVDDRQVVSLKAIKVLDCEGLCEGATEVTITILDEEDI